VRGGLKRPVITSIQDNTAFRRPVQGGVESIVTTTSGVRSRQALYSNRVGPETTATTTETQASTTTTPQTTTPEPVTPIDHRAERILTGMSDSSSNITDALERANNLAKGIAPNELEKMNPQQLKDQLNTTKKELTSLTDGYKKLQQQNTDTYHLLETLNQDKTVLGKNIEKLNKELKQQYETNNQIKPLQRELEDLRQKANESGGASSSELIKLQKENAKLQETVMELTLEKQEFQDSSNTISDLKVSRDLLQTENDENLMTIALLEEQVSSLKTEVESSYSQKQEADVNLTIRLEKLQKKTGFNFYEFE